MERTLSTAPSRCVGPGDTFRERPRCRWGRDPEVGRCEVTGAGDAQAHAERTDGQKGCERVRDVLQGRVDVLFDQVVRMATMVEGAVGRSMDSLKDRDGTLARAVVEGDDRIDALEVEVEEQCLAILALDHPVASDLRMVTTALKIVTDLERIADYAANVARITLRLEGQELMKPLVDIPRMAEIDRSMLRAAIQAFLHRDVELAYALVRDDDQVDALYNQVFRDLLEQMIADPRTEVVGQATQLIMAARHLERIGDHVINFAEWIIFMVTGERKALNN